MSLLLVLPVSTVLVVLLVQHPRCFGSRVDFDAFSSALPMLLRRAQDGKSWNYPKIHIYIYIHTYTLSLYIYICHMWIDYLSILWIYPNPSNSYHHMIGCLNNWRMLRKLRETCRDNITESLFALTFRALGLKPLISWGARVDRFRPEYYQRWKGTLNRRHAATPLFNDAMLEDHFRGNAWTYCLSSSSEGLLQSWSSVPLQLIHEN